VGRFFEFVSAIKPLFFAFENVPGILDKGYQGMLREGLSTVAKSYKLVGPVLLDAAKFGAPTARRRVFIFGFRTRQKLDLDIYGMPALPQRTVRDAIADLPAPNGVAKRDDAGQFWAPYPKDRLMSEYALRMREHPSIGLASERIRLACKHGLVSGLQPTIHTEAVKRRFATVESGRRDIISKFPRLSWNSPAPTLRAGTGRDRGAFQAARPIHPSEHRVISIREAARIQGFPDWFQFHPTKWHSFRMIGNSISPIIAADLLRLVRVAIGGME
jgi:DNA (cytosine-5)-methyltransferase 1